MPDDLDDMDRRFAGFGKLIAPAEIRKITNRVALAGKGDVLDQVVADIGPDRRMSGWARFQLGARYRVVSEGTAIVTPAPPGPMRVLTFGRKPTRLPKRKRLKVYAAPFGTFTATKESPIQIGPTKGKGTFTKASRTITARSPARVHAEITRRLAKVF